MARSGEGTLNCIHACHVVKKLGDADKALEILHAIKRTIDPLLHARGFRVLKLYEICCCTAGGKNLSVGGFCVPAGDGKTSLRIALRLRQPKSHRLHSFHHALRVMIHEVCLFFSRSHPILPHMSHPILPIHIWRRLFSLAHTPFFPTCHSPSFLYTSGGVCFLSPTPHSSPHVTPHPSYTHLEVSFFSHSHHTFRHMSHPILPIYIWRCLFLSLTPHCSPHVTPHSSSISPDACFLRSLTLCTRITRRASISSWKSSLSSTSV